MDLRFLDTGVDARFRTAGVDGEYFGTETPYQRDPAQRLLNLIAGDTGTALLWDYAKTDRRFAFTTGGANPSVDGDFVGLDLSSQSWGGRTLDEVVASQPEMVTNGGFAAGLTNWAVTAAAPNSVTAEAGGIRLVCADGANTNFNQVLTTVVGKLYCITAVIASVTGGNAISIAGSGGAGIGATISTPGVYKRYFIATTTSERVEIKRNSGAVNALIQSVSTKEVPGIHARQATANSRPKWYGGSKPYLLFDGTDDFVDSTLLPGPAGTVVSAFRLGTSGTAQYLLAGGETATNRRLRLGINASGRGEFTFNDQFSAVLPTDIRNTDAILVQTWGGSRRRCYQSGLPDPLVLDEARASNHNNTGNTYKIGSIDGAGSYANGRIYGTLIRSVETSDADVRNIILPAFRSLYP